MVANAWTSGDICARDTCMRVDGATLIESTDILVGWQLIPFRSAVVVGDAYE